jgi:hypothetical protein
MKYIYLIPLLLIFSGTRTFGQDSFVQDFTKIKEKLDIYLIDTHLNGPEKFALPAAVFTSFMTPQLSSSFLDECEKHQFKLLPYQVLLILEDTRKYHKAPSELLNESSDALIPTPYHLFLLQMKSEEQEIDLEKKYAEIRFLDEILTEQIKFRSSLLSLTYSTGFKKNPTLLPLPDDHQFSRDLDWIKQAEVMLNLGPEFIVKGNLVMSEEIPSSLEEENKIKMDDIKSLFDLNGLRFETNSVNASLGTESAINESVKFNFSMLVDYQSGSEKTAGLVSSMDFSIPNGSRLLVYSSFKAPVSMIISKKSGNPETRNLGGGAGIEFETSSGIKFRSGVDGLGTENPFINTGIIINSGKPPKK